MIRGVRSSSRPPPFTLRAHFVARHMHALEILAAFNHGNLRHPPRHSRIRFALRAAIAVPNSIAPEPLDRSSLTIYS